MPTDKHPRRAPSDAERRRDSGRTRDRILRAAMEEFGAHGYAGARVTRIAASAGVNAQLISYHFDGKAGLYEAVLTGWHGVTDLIPAPERPLGQIAAEFVRTTGANPAAARLVAWEGLGDRPALEEHPSVAEADRRRAAFLGDIVQQLRRRRESGELPADLDPGHLLFALFAMASAPVLLPQIARQIFGADADAADFQETYAEQVALLVGHITASEGPPDRGE